MSKELTLDLCLMRKHYPQYYRTPEEEERILLHKNEKLRAKEEALSKNPDLMGKKLNVDKAREAMSETQDIYIEAHNTKSREELFDSEERKAFIKAHRYYKDLLEEYKDCPNVIFGKFDKWCLGIKEG